MKNRVLLFLGFGLLCLTGAVLFRVGLRMRAEPAVDLNLLPERVLETLTIRPEELPEGYALLTDETLLSPMGLHRNPAFVSREADRKLQVQIGAFGGVLGVYGIGDEVLLLKKAYFFPDTESAETYLRVQEEQRRRINAYEVGTPGGGWYLFLATDPDREYSEAELAAILQGLERYRSRLNAVTRFSQIGDEAR